MRWWYDGDSMVFHKFIEFLRVRVWGILYCKRPSPQHLPKLRAWPIGDRKRRSGDNKHQNYYWNDVVRNKIEIVSDSTLLINWIEFNYHQGHIEGTQCSFVHHFVSFHHYWWFLVIIEILRLNHDLDFTRNFF